MADPFKPNPVGLNLFPTAPTPIGLETPSLDLPPIINPFFAGMFTSISDEDLRRARRIGQMQGETFVAEAERDYAKRKKRREEGLPSYAEEEVVAPLSPETVAYAERLQKEFPLDQTKLDAAAQAGTAAAKQIEAVAEEEYKNRPSALAEKAKRDRYNQLVDYFRPKTYEERAIEADRKIRDQEAREKAIMERDKQLTAEYEAQKFLERDARLREPEKPLPLYELGKDYFGQPIPTNAPAKTEAERQARVEKFNLTPGSTTEYALGGLTQKQLSAIQDPQQRERMVQEGQKQIASRDLKGILDKVAQRNAFLMEQYGYIPEPEYKYDEVLGRYVRTKPSTPAAPVAGTTSQSMGGFNFKTGGGTLR